MQSKGGYVLHMDGTCEGGSPHLFSCMDEISNIVLGNRKMPTEDSQYIIPLLQDLKAAYGDPVALVHDMGSAILKAVTTVFPGIADYICHFHFLRDIGKDLFNVEYRAIRRITRSYNIRAKLYRVSKQLKTIICGDDTLLESLEVYLLKDKEIDCHTETLDPHVLAYLLIAWVLESDSASNGFGFPFDQPHLEFYLRLQEAGPSLQRLKATGVSRLPLVTLGKILRDATLTQIVSRIQEKISVFEELRQAMRIACQDNNRGLNDAGDEDIKTIRERVEKFRYSTKVETLAKTDISYRKMVVQIDKYWDKLFADPISIETPTGNFIIQPQRTNNLMEQSFRFLKRDSRRKSGLHSLSKSLKGMLADTPLVRNLSNPDYMIVLLKGQKDLASRFADIDIQQVRKQEKENEERWRKYPKRMSRLFRIHHLPQKLMKSAA
ncbi:MAG: transposase [bacterium]|nr:transposase [bacterium]